MPVILKRSKRYKAAATKQVTEVLAIEPAIDVLKSFDKTKFDQSVELIFSLGIDAKQADQMIRGSLSLPHGVGKTKRVIAFCPEHLVTSALNNGAVKAGGQELVSEIEKTNFTDFDVAVSTPDMMRFVGRLGKVLVVGKVSFDKVKLAENINAMVAHIRRLKPQTSKGAFFKKVVLKGSMTPAVYLNVQ